jgi:hypothetical protein
VALVVVLEAPPDPLEVALGLGVGPVARGGRRHGYPRLGIPKAVISQCLRPCNQGTEPSSAMWRGRTLPTVGNVDLRASPGLALAATQQSDEA